MKHFLNSEFPHAILNSTSPYKISLYMKTHRTSPDRKQDPLVFKNLIADVAQQLQSYKQDTTTTLSQLNELLNNEDFWMRNADSIAILADDTSMVVYRLTRDVDTYVTVGSLFDIRPLVRHYQSMDQYYAVALSKDNFKVYVGNRYDIEEVIYPEETEITMSEVLGTELEGGSLNSGNYGGKDAQFHGHRARSEEEKIDAKRYYHFINEFLSKNLDISEQKPLVLIGVGENQGLFRSLTSINHIVDGGVKKSAVSLSDDEIRDEVWEVIEPFFLDKTEQLLNRYHTSLNDGMSTADIAEISIALSDGRVDTLVIDNSRSIPNTLGILKDYDKEEDILNILDHIALSFKTKIVVLPSEKMPSDTGAFSLLRF